MSEVGWLVTGAAFVACLTAAGWLVRGRRRELRLTAPDLELAAVDRMTPRQFTLFCAAILRALGYQRVGPSRARRGERGELTDLAGHDPGGALVVIRCLRQQDPVDAAAVSALRAAVTSGRHAGRAATLVTTARVAPDARALADGSGDGAALTVADRAVLRHWMEQARARVADASPPPRGVAGLRRDTTVLAGVIACAVVAVVAAAVLGGPGGTSRGGTTASAAGLAGAVPGSASGLPSASPIPSASPAPPRSAPASPSAHRSPSAAPAGDPGDPRQVVRAFYAAISGHDWPRVWRLGGRNLGYGPYATYRGMIAGYAGTVRDEVTDLRARGNQVSGHFRAYHSDGQVRTYRFSYLVRGGVIASGAQFSLGG
jgi:hypothetical protein